MAKVASRNFSDISGVCSLFCANKSTLLFLSREGPGVGGPSKQAFGSAAGGTRVILSGEQTNLSKGLPEVFFEEIDPALNCFIIDQPTVAVGALTSARDVCLQACLKGLRVVRITCELDDSSSGMGSEGSEGRLHYEALQDAILEEDIDMGGMGGAPGETVVSVDCSGEEGWVIVLSSTGNIYVMNYDAEDESLVMKYTWKSSDISFQPSAEEPCAQADRVVSVSMFYGRLPLEAAHDSILTAIAATEVKTSVVESAVRAAGGESDSNASISKSSAAIAAEEAFLYGSSLCSDPALTSAGEEESKERPRVDSSTGCSRKQQTGNESECASDTMEEPGDENGVSIEPLISNEDQTYAVLVDRSGRISFIQLTFSHSSLLQSSLGPIKVFQTCPLGTLPNFIPVTKPSSSAVTAQKGPNPPLPPPKRFVVDARLCYLGHHERHEDMLSLCLVAVMNTGDVVVYNGIQSPSALLTPRVDDQCTGIVEHKSKEHISYHKSSTVQVFSKVGHYECTRKRRAARLATERLRRAARGASAHSRETVQSLLTVTPSSDKNDRGVSIIVSGAQPLVVSSLRGLPCVQPLGLPEIPYAGMGAHLSSYFSAGDTKGLAVLWREDKLDAEETIARAGARAVTCLSTLGIYKDVAGLINYPRSSVTVAKTKVGLTTHKSLALNGSRTEDKTQQAMLATPTFLLSCSERKEVPFVDDVFTPSEVEAEEGAYVRFFPDLTSFCSPVNDMAAPPKMSKVEHKLVLMQGRNKIVDTFALEERERVLDVCVLYLTTGKVVADSSTSESNVIPSKGKKRVFLAAGTCYDDKHGEDSRGEGRLLFFSLDYAMYTQQQEVSAEVSSTAEGSTVPGSSDREGLKDGMDDGAEYDPEQAGDVASTEKASQIQNAQQPPAESTATTQFFDSITPKLRLVWSGLGPSSVVMQFRDEYVLATVGSTLYMYQLNQETMELDQIAFIYAQVCFICI
jgi:hypothetical protein